MQDRIKLFTTAMLQVMFVSMNVIFLKENILVLTLISAFCISWLWSSNVKKIAISGTMDRLIYSTGAMAGTLIGYLSSNYISELFK